MTPFLKEQFNKSISYGGTVLTLSSVGMSVGSISAGLLLQKKILHHFTLMGSGAMCLCIGLLVTFTSQLLPQMRYLTPILAYPGVFIAGAGDPLMTIATLRALYNIQVSLIQKLKILAEGGSSYRWKEKSSKHGG